MLGLRSEQGGGVPPDNKMWLLGGNKQTSGQTQLKMLQLDLTTTSPATDRPLQM